MNKLIKFLLLLLAAAMIFAACEGGGDTTSAIETDEMTDAPSAEDIKIVADGASEYKIIRGERAGNDVINAAVAFRAEIREKYGISLKIEDDYEKPGTDPATRHQFEILIGSTNREESSAATEELSYNDSVIAVIGSRIVISGGNDEAIIRALSLFSEKYLAQDGITLPGDLHEINAAEYQKQNITIGGIPLEDYVIGYNSGYSDMAKELAHRLGKLCGVRMRLSNAKDVENEHMIFVSVGSYYANIYDSVPVKFGPDDFMISSAILANDNKNLINFFADNKTSVGMACAEFVDILAKDDKTAYELSDIKFEYKLPATRDYINDIESLPMHWAIEFDTPDWMLDFDEKYAATIDPSGRLMSCAHRGDMVYYPENSIEGIISSILMGADMVEIDPRKTKDGVFILLHDETLTRTTNVSEMAGKNGLPTSHKVSDWTYEQLMQLNLKEKSGGSSANVTVYKIPTLEEAIKVCANRIYIRLDVKGPANSSNPFWDYERDIWPMMEKYKSYSNIIFTWHDWFTANNYKIPVTYREKAETLGAYPAPMFVSDAKTLANTMRPIRSHELNPGVRLFIDANTANYSEYIKDNKSKLDSYRGKLRTYIDAHNQGNESHEFYAELYEGGINYLLVNKALLLCQYIAENFDPAPYTE